MLITYPHYFKYTIAPTADLRIETTIHISTGNVTLLIWIPALGLSLKMVMQVSVPVCKMHTR